MFENQFQDYKTQNLHHSQQCNTVSLSGCLLGLPNYRVSPAGVETAHFNFWHESTQAQDTAKLALKHKVEFAINVSVVNKQLIINLKNSIKDINSGDKFWLKITGYLAMRKYRHGEQKVVLHAYEITTLEQNH